MITVQENVAKARDAGIAIIGCMVHSINQDT